MFGLRFYATNYSTIGTIEKSELNRLSSSKKAISLFFVLFLGLRTFV
ncbi:hypothetical protein VCHA50P417_100152 [Vibrio chagasii]|nr:hypothetical protein VCHA34P115_310008 [Vibrio chagasii]CAH6910993.1 hypothetical protein VCHA50P417_100152 [Vibrio chagasii]CAH6938718.1 hypothetical protein VCHA53P481_100159 [Vibrio chagasii]CAH7122231.1 hypothetical protein VCHA35O142_90149 [Vibrio chagasii]CAH7155891.1 hypothetical protein VCHA42O253_100160 [Vibrio chagasii]